jgi:hypothetical protein
MTLVNTSVTRIRIGSRLIRDTNGGRYRRPDEATVRDHRLYTDRLTGNVTIHIKLPRNRA